MKYRIIFFSLLLSSFLAAQKDSCHIRVQIEGFNGGKVKLIGVYADNNYFADSAFVDEQGRFEFKRKSPLKPGYFYIILPDYSNFHMMVDHEQFFSMKAKKEDVIGTMEIKGSIDNVLLYESLRLQVRHDKEIDSLNTLKKTLAANDPAQVKIEQAFNRIASERKEQLEKFQKNHPNTLFSKFKVAGQNPELVDVRLPDGQPDRAKQLQYFRNAFWDNVDLADLRMLHTPVMVNKLKRYITELTVQQPDSIIRVADMIIQKSLVQPELFKFVSNWIALKYQPTQTAVMGGENVFVHILEKWFTRKNAYWLTEKDFTEMEKKIFEMKPSLLNAIGPDVISTDLYGKTRSIYEIKSDYVIVFMYDPVCEHCQKETPLLREFYKTWKAKGVEVFAIVLNTNDKEWRDFIKKNQIESWINVHDPTNRSIYAKYFVDITPELYVLNKERRIIGKNLKVDQLPMILEREMGKGR